MHDYCTSLRTGTITNSTCIQVLPYASLVQKQMRLLLTDTQRCMFCLLMLKQSRSLLLPLFLLSVKITNKYEFVIIRILFISIHAIRRSDIIFFIIRVGSTVCHILKAYKVQISISIISKVLT